MFVLNLTDFVVCLSVFNLVGSKQQISEVYLNKWRFASCIEEVVFVFQAWNGIIS